MTSLHDAKVDSLARRVKELYKQKTPFRIFHGSTNSTRALVFKNDEVVDISRLDKVLSVDATAKTAVVEANVPMDKLVTATLAYGLLPPVVMEFPGITVGGAIQGNGGESSSFKWGTFNQTFNWYEVITSHGTVLKPSATEHVDLFKAIPGSAGTIAVLTAAEIQLVPAKRYVVLTYTPVGSFVEAKVTIESLVSNDVDFIDGIMFSNDSGVIISGRLSDTKVGKVRNFSRAHDNWYYLHVDSQRHVHPDGWTETLPLKAYLFRYDRGAFWVGRFAFDIFHVPYTRFMRWLLDPLLHTRKLYQALQESGTSQQHVIQDVVLPADAFVRFSDFIDEHFAVYPLWLCPMLPDLTAPFQLNNLSTDLIINVGIWGAGIAHYDEFIHANKLIENKILELGGKKWSYAHSYFNESDFWKMYDKKRYDMIRTKYHATTLPTIYDKITVKQRYSVQKKKALLKTLFGLAKLKVKAAEGSHAKTDRR